MKPDGDAMGSSVALYHFIGMCAGHSVKIVLNDRYPDYLGFLAEDIPASDMIIWQERPVEAETAIKDSDLVICLDFNVFHRTDKLEQALTESKADKVLIDHHLNPDRASFELSFSETDISSASELLYHILMETGKIAHDATMLPHRAATALMTGMTTDTNNFANSVYPSTFTMASELIAAGVDRDMIIGKIYNRFKESRIRLQGHMLKDLMQTTPYGVAYMVLDRQTMLKYNVEEGDTEGFVNIPLTIDDIVMSIFIKEDNGYARVSIRSKKGTSANRCARLHFHGGGHENAAGGRLYIPEDIPTIGLAGDYIEKVTYDFINGENEEK